MKIASYGISNVGMKRGQNEDNYLVADLTKRDPSLPQIERAYELGDRGVLGVNGRLIHREAVAA